MKKSSATSRPPPVVQGTDKPAAKVSITASSQPLEKAKTDTANIPAQGRKNSKDDKGALTKNLSKSHDNLASILRKRAAAATLAGNKENIKDRVLSPAPVTFKTPKTGTPIRKTQSSHNIDNSGTPIKRAQSAQNISKASSGSNRDKNSLKVPAVKRASSTQNVNKSPSRQRLSNPTNSVSHNAELLATFEKERRTYEAKISELIQCSESRKVELERKKIVLKKSAEEIRDIKQENRLYREKLQELGVTLEHLTDADKLQLIHRREDSYKSNCATGVDAHAGSTRASSVHRDGSEGDILSQHLGREGSENALSLGDLSCVTPEHPSSFSYDWETKSNKSSDATSEISVACLQDRISQMEETHYSTNEELEATRLELADLQDNVNELTCENESLCEDKTVLLESLCTQTEKLENCRLQIEHLKTLLVGDGNNQNWSLQEKQLVELIKTGQQEKEELLLREKELNNQLHQAENSIREQQDEITALRDTGHLHNMKIDSLASDKRVLEVQLSEVKEQSAKDQIEIARYRSLLDSEKQRVTELEQERNATEKSDLEDLLDNTRTEKDRLEEKLTNTQEELAVSINELTKLRETIASLEEDIVVCKKNAKTEMDNMEFRIQKVEQEKQDFQLEAEQLREHVDQLQIDCDSYLEEKRSHLATIAKLEAELRALQNAEQELDKKIRDEKMKFGQEKEEWEQFQMDLQLAVKVAADFKTEAQEDMERLIAERLFYKQRMEEMDVEIAQAHEEIARYKSQQQQCAESDILKRELRGKMISTVDRELAVMRNGQKLSDARSNATGAKENISVKHLIATIEKQVKTDRGTPPLSPSVISLESGNSRRNSTESTISLGSIKSETSPKVVLERRTSHPADLSFKNVLRRTPESKMSESGRSPLGHRHTITNIIMETDDSKQAASPTNTKTGTDSVDSTKKPPLTGILSNKSSTRKSSISTDLEAKLAYSGVQGQKTDPLAILAKQMGGSKRNALLKWCQHKLASYPGVDITNFSSSWNDGLAFCALLHTYLPDKIPYKQLNTQDKVKNFTLAFNAAKNEGIQTHLNINEMVAIERPDWQAVMSYITSIYKHFEIDAKSS